MPLFCGICFFQEKLQGVGGSPAPAPTPLDRREIPRHLRSRKTLGGGGPTAFPPWRGHKSVFKSAALEVVSLRADCSLIPPKNTEECSNNRTPLPREAQTNLPTTELLFSLRELSCCFILLFFIFSFLIQYFIFFKKITDQISGPPWGKKKIIKLLGYLDVEGHSKKRG